MRWMKNELVKVMGGPAHGKMSVPARYFKQPLIWPNGYIEDFVYELSSYRKKDGSIRFIFRPKDRVVK